MAANSKTPEQKCDQEEIESHLTQWTRDLQTNRISKRHIKESSETVNTRTSEQDPTNPNRVHNAPTTKNRRSRFPETKNRSVKHGSLVTKPTMNQTRKGNTKRKYCQYENLPEAKKWKRKRKWPAAISWIPAWFPSTSASAWKKSQQQENEVNI